jgi:hypothetical protein
MGEKSIEGKAESKKTFDLSKNNNSNSSLENKSKDYLDYCTEDYLLSLAKIYNTTQGYVKLDRMYKDITRFMDYVNRKNSEPVTRLFSMDERDVKEILTGKNY